MDKVELGIKLEQISKLAKSEKYKAASKVADSIEWRKVKKWSDLSLAAEVYEKAGRYKEARNVCVYAYNRNLGGKRLVYMLTELSILIKDFDEAEDLYNEYVELASDDAEHYLLLYKINKARGASYDKLIEILENYKESEVDEKYAFELAQLYAQADRIDECIRECDNLILWFSDGEYVEQALRLKKKYTELSKSQKSQLNTIEECRAAGIPVHNEMRPDDYTDDGEEEPEEEPVPAGEDPDKADIDAITGKPAEDEIKIPEKDYSIYDTQIFQAELAKNMAQIMEKMKKTVEEAPKMEGLKMLRPDGTPMSEDEYALYLQAKKEEEERKALEVEVTPEEKSILLGDGPARNKNAAGYPTDEPTKEIRINNHHWRRYISRLDEEEEKAREEERYNTSRLPAFLFSKTETEGEIDTSEGVVVSTVEDVVTLESAKEEKDASNGIEGFKATPTVELTEDEMARIQEAAARQEEEEALKAAAEKEAKEAEEAAMAALEARLSDEIAEVSREDEEPENEENTSTEDNKASTSTEESGEISSAEEEDNGDIQPAADDDTETISEGIVPEEVPTEATEAVSEEAPAETAETDEMEINAAESPEEAVPFGDTKVIPDLRSFDDVGMTAKEEEALALAALAETVTIEDTDEDVPEGLLEIADVVPYTDPVMDETVTEAAADEVPMPFSETEAEPEVSEITEEMPAPAAVNTLVQNDENAPLEGQVDLFDWFGSQEEIPEDRIFVPNPKRLEVTEPEADAPKETIPEAEPEADVPKETIPENETEAEPEIPEENLNEALTESEKENVNEEIKPEEIEEIPVTAKDGKLTTVSSFDTVELNETAIVLENELENQLKAAVTEDLEEKTTDTTMEDVPAEEPVKENEPADEEAPHEPVEFVVNPFRKDVIKAASMDTVSLGIPDAISADIQENEEDILSEVSDNDSDDKNEGSQPDLQEDLAKEISAIIAEETKETVTESEPIKEQTTVPEAEIVPEPEEAPEAVAEFAPEEAPEAVAEPAPEEIKEEITESVPEVKSEPAPEVVAEATPESVPEVAVEAAPEPASEAAAEATPEPIPEAAVEAAPKSASEAVTEAAPEPRRTSVSEYGDESENSEPEKEEKKEGIGEGERQYLNKYLFMNGMEESVVKLLKGKKEEVKDGTSRRGNILVTGRSKSDKTGFAINLFKAMHAYDENRNFKIAKTNATVLNQKGIGSSADSIKGGTLIIEHGGQLYKRAAAELVEFMKQDTGSMLFILTGEEFAIKKLFADVPEFGAMFDYSFEIRQYTINELVSVAKEYAKNQGYYIDDKAVLKLYLKIGGIESTDTETDLDKVRALVDEAIERKGKKKPKKNSLIPLKPKDFGK